MHLQGVDPAQRTTKKGLRFSSEPFGHNYKLLFTLTGYDLTESAQIVNRTCVPTVRENCGTHLRGMIRTP